MTVSKIPALLAGKRRIGYLRAFCCLVSGQASGTANPTIVMLDGNKTITANFTGSP